MINADTQNTQGYKVAGTRLDSVVRPPVVKPMASRRQCTHTENRTITSYFLVLFTAKPNALLILKKMFELTQFDLRPKGVTPPHTHTHTHTYTHQKDKNNSTTTKK